MRQVVGLPVVLAVLVGPAIGLGPASGTASAQRSHRGGGGGARAASANGAASTGGAGNEGAPLNLQKEQLGSAELPGIGRSRMRNGDCAGALQAFDEALRTLTDPTIFRDRGICHEQLGDVYPAIDDYRVYLTEQPEAPDAAGIARRLQALEDKASGRTTTASTNDDDTPPDLRATGGVHVKKGSPGSASDGQGSTASDKLEYVEPDEDAANSSLRKGTGLSLAPFFSEHKWLGGSAFSGAGDGQTWSESFGIQVRYALSPRGALVGEIGYEYFNATSIDTVQIAGLTSLIGYELRFPLDPGYDDQVLLVPELGYEHLSVSVSDEGGSSTSIGAFVPRLRLGWRHMLEAATALDLSLDAGAGSFFQYAKFPFDSTQSASGIVTLNVSVAWGL